MTEIVLTSFGYAHGNIPEQAVAVYDLRHHFRDPHFDPDLRHLTADDERVQTVVLNTPGIIPLINGMATCATAYLSGPSVNPRLDIAIGCVGGKHRAPAVATEFGRILRAWGYHVRVEHRDIDKPVVQR